MNSTYSRFLTGDTGTNMTMTIMSAAREVAAIEHPDMESLAKAISSYSLRAPAATPALFFPSFSVALQRNKDGDKITTTTLARFFVRGTETLTRPL